MSEHSINLAYLPWIVDVVRKASFGAFGFRITHEIKKGHPKIPSTQRHIDNTTNDVL